MRLKTEACPWHPSSRTTRESDMLTGAVRHPESLASRGRRRVRRGWPALTEGPRAAFRYSAPSISVGSSTAPRPRSSASKSPRAARRPRRARPRPLDPATLARALHRILDTLRGRDDRRLVACPNVGPSRRATAPGAPFVAPGGRSTRASTRPRRRRHRFAAVGRPRRHVSSRPGTPPSASRVGARDQRSEARKPRSFMQSR